MAYPSFDNPRSVTICSNHNGAYKTTCARYNVKRMEQFYFNDSNIEWEDIMEWEDIDDE